MATVPKEEDNLKAGMQESRRDELRIEQTKVVNFSIESEWNNTI